MPGQHSVRIEIFDLSGSLIYATEKSGYEEGFVSSPVFWERKNVSGGTINPGIYPYRLTITVISDDNNSNYSGVENGSLIIIP